MRKSLSKIVVLLAALALVPTTVSADPTAPYINGWGCATNHGGYPVFTPVYFECLGAYTGNNVGNSTNTNFVLAAISGAWGPFAFVENQDALAAPGPFKAVPSTGSGYLEFVSPITGSFVLALKTTNAFSLYYFKDVVNLAGVDFTTAGVAPLSGGNLQGLSHATVYFNEGSTVPEPATVVLLATGLLGLGIVERRRRRSS